MQFLYAHGLAAEEGFAPDELAAALDRFWALRQGSRHIRRDADALIRAAVEFLPEADAQIAALSENFALDRVTAVDRSILRLALYEMVKREDVPPIVALNEAIEIAKRFGTPDSWRFVNGILDQFAKSLDRPLRQVPKS